MLGLAGFQDGLAVKRQLKMDMPHVR